MNRWKDWYEHGKCDLGRAILDLKYGYYEWACFPSGKPADYFTEKQAKEAIDAADYIIRFCEGLLLR